MAESAVALEDHALVAVQEAFVADNDVQADLDHVSVELDHRRKHSYVEEVEGNVAEVDDALLVDLLHVLLAEVVPLGMDLGVVAFKESRL